MCELCQLCPADTVWRAVFGVYPTWPGALLESFVHREWDLLLTAERNALLKRGITTIFYLKYC